MAYDIPTMEPTSHEAGTTLKFTRSYSDHPADTWTLTYYLRNDTAAPISIICTADGNTHSVSETAATTLTWTPGTYELTGYVTDGTDTYKVYSGRIEITPDKSTTFNYDIRGKYERMLDEFETQMQVWAPEDVVSYSINGRSFTLRSAGEREEMHQRLRRLALMERRGGKLQTFKTRFSKAV